MIVSKQFSHLNSLESPFCEISNKFTQFFFHICHVYTFIRSLICTLIPFIRQEYRCMYLLIVMAIFWVTEALPLYVTSMLPIIAFPLMGIMVRSTASIETQRNRMSAALLIVLSYNKIVSLLLYRAPIKHVDSISRILWSCLSVELWQLQQLNIAIYTSVQRYE